MWQIFRFFSTVLTPRSTFLLFNTCLSLPRPMQPWSQEVLHNDMQDLVKVFVCVFTNNRAAAFKLSRLMPFPLLLPQLSILQEQPRKDAGDAALSSSPSSSSTSSMLTPTSAGHHDPSLSCPSTPSTQHGKLAAMPGAGCPSPVATLRRPTALSRHASAAGPLLQHQCL